MAPETTGPQHRKSIAADSHSLMRGGPAAVTLAGLERGARAMDRIEQAFVATAVTGFLVMLVAFAWMMMS